MDGLVELFVSVLALLWTLLTGLVRFAFFPLQVFFLMNKAKAAGRSTTPYHVTMLAWTSGAACITGLFINNEQLITYSLLATILLGVIALLTFATSAGNQTVGIQTNEAPTAVQMGKQRGRTGATWLGIICVAGIGLVVAYTANFYTFRFKNQLHTVIKPHLTLEPIYFDLDANPSQWKTVASSRTLRYYMNQHYQTEWMAYQARQTGKKWKNKVKKAFKSLFKKWKRRPTPKDK